MQLAELPNRRVEAWKYSDLRAALAESEPLIAREGRDIIERLAPGTQRSVISAGEERLFIERMDDAHLDARAFEFDLAPGARLTRVVIQTGDGPALSVARVRVAAGAQFRQLVFAEGSRLARIETHVEIAGEGAEVALNGAYLAAKGRHADLTSTITHKTPNAQTRQLIKGVVRAGGRGVFQGKILVEQAAQKTDARQYHHALLLEEGAEVFAKPELMIFADDVQCAHGNTAGALDETALFYLRSRGVPEHQARALLIEAFLGEVLEEGIPEALQAELRARIGAWLGGAP